MSPQAHRHAGPGGGAVLASAAVHGVLLLGAWWAHHSFEPPLEYEAVQIEIVSLPPAAEVEEPELDEPDAAVPEELVVETPDPTPPDPEPDPVPVPAEEPEPEPDPEPDPDPEPPTPSPPEEDPAPPATTESAETEVGGEDINTRMEGLRRDYPVYYENIIRQIRRCFRWRGGGRWSTRVRFEITRSGSVSDIRVIQPSGSPTFDIEAEGAVECAGRGSRFGPLPEDLPFDRLPVEFMFTPDG